MNLSFETLQQLTQAFMTPKGFVRLQRAEDMWDLTHTNGLKIIAYPSIRVGFYELLIEVSSCFIQKPQVHLTFMPRFEIEPDAITLATIKATKETLLFEMDAQIGQTAWDRLRAVSHVLSAHFQTQEGFWSQEADHDLVYRTPTQQLFLPKGHRCILEFLHTQNLQHLHKDGAFDVPKMLFLERYGSAHEALEAADHIAWVQQHLVLS